MGISRLFPEQVGAALEQTVPNSRNTEWYQLVEGSIYDGDTLRVERNGQELKIRFCGTDSPEIEQPGGIEARDHLRSLITQGDGSIGVVLTGENHRGTHGRRPVVIRRDGSEIHLNSQMVMDGHAYHDEKYSGSCPQPDVLVRAEALAKEQSAGVWANPDAEKPWDYRKRS